MCPRPLRVVFIVGPRLLQNPMCGNWINWLAGLGHCVACLYWAPRDPTTEELADWGVGGGVSVRSFSGALPGATRQAMCEAVGGEPDVLFCWEGVLTLLPLRVSKHSFPDTRAVFLIDTHPIATSLPSELAHVFRYWASSALIGGYIFYSESMRRLFHRQVLPAAHKPYLALVEPFPERAFDDSEPAHLPDDCRLRRSNNDPHVIFTGNASMLWSSGYREAREAVGEFLVQLARRNVQVFVNPAADLRAIPNLHHYPPFCNAELLDGTFARYISQFDAHLVFYRERNGTIRRRVSSGLSTRFAFAMTSTCPIAVSRTSQFIHEHWSAAPFGFMFDRTDDLVESLNDRELLRRLRNNMRSTHRSYSFESCSGRISDFLAMVCTARTACV
jgi:hypothetical protein